MSGGGPGRKKHGDGGGHGGSWVVTFADLVSLLMAFFVMIVSFSVQDTQKVHQAAGSIRDAFGVQNFERPAGMIERDGVPVRDMPRTVGIRFKEGCMGRLRLNALWSAVAIVLLWSVSGCGGGKKAGTPIFPGRVSLSPSSVTSLDLGATLNFTASAQTVSGTNIATPISFTSSNTSILTLAPQ